MKIEAKVCEMAQSELLQIIPASEYARIKEQDPHPEFRAYAIAHEGESRGRLGVAGMSCGEVVKRWAKTAIEKINAKLAYGLPIFHFHGNPNNDRDGRQPIGEVVGRALREIGGRLHAIAVAYIKPEYRSAPMDIASIEADVVYDTLTQDVDVKGVSAIALGNSKMMQPGFAGARILAAVSEFAENTGGSKPMTAAEIKAAILAAGLSPSDVFTSAQIYADPMVIDHVREKTSGEYAHRRRTEEDLAKIKETMKAEHDKAIKGLQDENATLRATTLRVQAKEKLPVLIQARKLDATQQKFIAAKLDTFTPTAVDKLDAEMNAFLDAQIIEYNKTAELLGIKKTPAPADAGTPPSGAFQDGAADGDIESLRKELIPGYTGPQQQ